MGQTFKTQGIILRRMSGKGTERRYIIFTEDYGKVMAVAQGTKKITSKLAGHLEPLTLSALFFAQSKKMDKLAGSQMLVSFCGIKNDLEKINSACLAIECIERLTPYGLIDQRIFQLCKAYLSWLDEFPHHPLAQLAFIIKLLDILGWRPIVSAQQKDLTKVLNFLLRSDFLQVVKLKLTPELWKTLKGFVKQQLNEQLDQPLQTVCFLV